MSDVFTNIKSIGVANIAASHGCTVTSAGFFPCPACGATNRHTKRQDPRPACLVIKEGNAWQCLQCAATGDTVDLLARFLNQGKRPSNPQEWRAVLARWSDSGGGGAMYPLPRPVAPLSGQARPLPARPPFGSLMQLWGRAGVEPPKSSLVWLATKFPKYTLTQIVESGVVRWLPRQDNPDFWPWNHSYMAMLAFDHHGLVQSIHGRIIGEPLPGKPKSRFPKGYSASGLVLANKTGVSWLRGKMPVQDVLIAEGLTSTLAATMAMRATGKWKWAVFGYTSGSNSAIEQMPWSGQTVYVMTDNDEPGNLYAEKIMKALPGNINLRRGTL
jgi:hypothetical protein